MAIRDANVVGLQHKRIGDACQVAGRANVMVPVVAEWPGIRILSFA